MKNIFRLTEKFFIFFFKERVFDPFLFMKTVNYFMSLNFSFSNWRTRSKHRCDPVRTSPSYCKNLFMIFSYTPNIKKYFYDEKHFTSKQTESNMHAYAFNQCNCMRLAFLLTQIYESCYVAAKNWKPSVGHILKNNNNNKKLFFCFLLVKFLYVNI